MIAADKAGKTPQEFVAEIAAGRKPYPRRLPHLVRQLALDRRSREPRARARTSTCTSQGRPDRGQAGRAVLRSGQVDVPARPLHPRRVPGVRHARPLRRQLRRLRLGLRGDGAEEPAFGAVRRDAGAEVERALLLPALVAALPRLPQALDERARAAAARGAEQDQRVVQGRRARPRRPRRLGHQPRRALLRHRDPRRARQVLLRLARRAGRLPRVAEELLRQGRREGERRAALVRRVHGRPGGRADPLHRQGHHLLPHPVLAGDAEVQRPQGARPRLRARLHHRQRREDEQEPRHRHLAAALPRDRHERRVAALLHRGQAELRTSRTSSSTPTTSSPASTATWSASTSTSPAGPRTSSTSSFAGDAPLRRRHRGASSRRRGVDAATVAELLRGARVRQGAARDHGDRRPHQRRVRRRAAVAARQGSGARRRAAGRLLARAARLPGPLDPARAGAAGARRVASRASCSAAIATSPGSDVDRVPTRIAPYQHLLQRVDPKQLDALFEAPAEAAAPAAAAASAPPPTRSPCRCPAAKRSRRRSRSTTSPSSTCASPSSSPARRSRARPSC